LGYSFQSPVLTNSNIRVFVDGHTFSSRCSESITGSADINRLASEVISSTLAITFLTVLGTGLVGVAGVYGDSSALMNPMEGG